MKTQTGNCPKCGGSGRIQAFSHIASGDCFMCGATGVVAAGREEKKPALNEETRRAAEWVMRSTERSYVNLSYARLLRARNFCHGGYGVERVYPELRTKWFEVGELAFRAAQERKHEEWEASL